MVLAGEYQQPGFRPLPFQSRVVALALFQRSAKVVLAVDHEGWCPDPGYVSERALGRKRLR